MRYSHHTAQSYLTLKLHSFHRRPDRFARCSSFIHHYEKVSQIGTTFPGGDSGLLSVFSWPKWCGRRLGVLLSSGSVQFSVLVRSLRALRFRSALSDVYTCNYAEIGEDASADLTCEKWEYEFYFCDVSFVLVGGIVGLFERGVAAVGRRFWSTFYEDVWIGWALRKLGFLLFYVNENWNEKVSKQDTKKNSSLGLMNVWLFGLQRKLLLHNKY